MKKLLASAALGLSLLAGDPLLLAANSETQVVESQSSLADELVKLMDLGGLVRTIMSTAMDEVEGSEQEKLFAQLMIDAILEPICQMMDASVHEILMDTPVSTLETLKAYKTSSSHQKMMAGLKRAMPTVAKAVMTITETKRVPVYMTRMTDLEREFLNSTDSHTSQDSVDGVDGEALTAYVRFLFLQEWRKDLTEADMKEIMKYENMPEIKDVSERINDAFTGMKDMMGSDED